MSRGQAVSTRALLVSGFLVALLIAGVAGFVASDAPDGLSKVSQDQGFAGSAEQHDGWLSYGAAGVLGVVVVLVLAGGVTLLVRRRRPAEG